MRALVTTLYYKKLANHLACVADSTGIILRLFSAFLVA